MENRQVEQTSCMSELPATKKDQLSKYLTSLLQLYSKLTTGKPLKTSWEEKMRKRAEAKSIKNYEKQLKENRAKEKEAARLRAVEKQKRKEENQRKSEIVQTIKNTAKIKRMRKKQLRQIQKR